MWQPILFRTRTSRRRPQNPRERRISLERLEERTLLSYTDFELSSLLPANGGDGSKGVVASGIVDQGFLGSPLYGYHSLGDVNQDGVDDMLTAAATQIDPAGNAHVYLIFGRPAGFPAEFDLHTLDGTTGYAIDGIDAGDRAGLGGGGVGDVNRDGVPDFAILANEQTPSGDELIGDRTFVLFGGATHLAALDVADGSQDGRISLASNDGTNGFQIDGIPAPGVVGSRFFTRINGAGDVNGDHIADIVIGDGHVGSAVAPGKVFVVFGRDSTAGHLFPATVQLATLDGSNGFVVPGLGDNDLLEVAVGGDGDVNGDGIGDLVLGAMYVDPAGRNGAG
jgi:hypothetical protein